MIRLPPRGSAGYQGLVDRRPVSPEVHDSVRQILAAVRVGGDRALLELTARFDGVQMTQTQVARGEWQAALSGLDANVREALAEMARRIQAVHQAQQFQEPAVMVAP
ncbi:MAG TPA: histidinol dehydrogenase, partial [Candidatus Dormibacteraeota bacterium]|nr:histidinol dehydrogenase [Candidatus Dormibacteraeota bacterium]